MDITLGKLSPYLALSLLTAAMNVSAQDPDAVDLDWRASVGLVSEITNNAGKVHGEDTLSERQDEARLELGGDYSNSLIELGVNYRASERRFDKDSQKDRRRLEGRSELTIGKPYHLGDLYISHTRQSVLNAPDDVDLLANTDEREILTARPSLRWRASAANTFVTSGNYARIDYRFAPERRSERTGATLTWLRRMSPTDNFTFTAQQTEIAFDAAPEVDYDLTTLAVTYAVELRQLSYSLRAGRNRTKPAIGESVSRPTYSADINYTSGPNLWSLSASRFLTDSSGGGGSAGEFDRFNPRDASTARLDQMERIDAEFTWRTQALCQRCSLSAGLFYRADDYQEIDEDRSELGARAGLDYRLAPSTSVRLSWDRRDHSFDEDSDRPDYRLTRTQVSYNHRFISGLNTRVYVRYHQRGSHWADADASRREYTEAVAGFGLTYDLL
ncbi:hypothetical protein [Marinimicrobium alkaliphilum]|uniref:hypothetical protein n=1 Tax=Marinimicrobium alkaliphilum TaxID=2202654 RepID=UPI000DB988B1|nr:hypothetical protein [Marinimicrobium alkaliphilum]